MAVFKRYILRIFVNLKYITANVMDRSNGEIVAKASTLEECIFKPFQLNRISTETSATIVGEVLARRIKGAGLESYQELGIYANVKKEIERSDSKHPTKVWAVVNSLKYYGVKLIVEGNE